MKARTLELMDTPEDQAIGLLFAVDPSGLGGVRVRGPHGVERDAWLAWLRELLPTETVWRKIPVNIEVDRLLGGLDVAATMTMGKPVFASGLLELAAGDVVMLPMAERLPSEVCAIIASALDRREVRVERDGFTRLSPSEFSVIAFDEGLEDEALDPALADRLAFSFRATASETVDYDPSVSRIVPQAQQRLSAVTVAGDVLEAIAGTALAVGAPSMRAEYLTLRAGLGLVLATQNPVDLDYKGLSNTGTWFIGRLQTERDKARVMDGLEGAAHGGRFDRRAMEQTLAGLGKRRFLLHNVHEDEAVVFGTRWVMSYLAGPMTRDQIAALMADRRPPEASVADEDVARPAEEGGDAPVLPPGIEEFWLPAAGDELHYHPRLLAIADMAFNNARYHVSETRQKTYTVEFDDGPVPVDWSQAETIMADSEDLDRQGADDARYAECPAVAMQAKQYARWQRDFKRWVRQAETITLYRSKKYRLTSEPGETEGAFRVRLQQLANEKRDVAIAKLRKRYATKATTLENRLMRARQAIEREQQQSTKKKLDTAVSFGTAILGAVLGRKKLSSTTANKMGTAIRSASGASKEAADVKRAKETAAKVAADLQALNETLEQEVDALEDAYDAQTETLTEIEVKAKVADIHVPVTGLLWMPYRDAGDGRLTPAWQAS